MSGLERGEKIWIFEREEKWKRWREMREKEKRALNNVIRVESRRRSTGSVDPENPRALTNRAVDRVGRPKNPETTDRSRGRPQRSAGYRKE